MKQSIDTPKICFVHLPKTAGSSLREMLRENYIPAHIFNGNTMLDYIGKTKEDMANYKLYLGHIYYYRALEILPEDTEYITVLRNPINRVRSLYYFWKSHSDEYVLNQDLPEVLRKGPALAKKYDFIDFIQIDDTYLQQSISNNQARQLFPEKIGHHNLMSKDPNEVYGIIKKELSKFKVIGTQELFSFFIFKLNKAFLRKNLYFPSIIEKNISSEVHDQEWKNIPLSEKENISKLLRDKNKIDFMIYKDVYSKNISEMKFFFSKMTNIPLLYR